MWLLLHYWATKHVSFHRQRQHQQQRHRSQSDDISDQQKKTEQWWWLSQEWASYRSAYRSIRWHSCRIVGRASWQWYCCKSTKQQKSWIGKLAKYLIANTSSMVSCVCQRWLHVCRNTKIFNVVRIVGAWIGETQQKWHSVEIGWMAWHDGNYDTDDKSDVFEPVVYASLLQCVTPKKCGEIRMQQLQPFKFVNNWSWTTVCLFVRQTLTILLLYAVVCSINNDLDVLALLSPVTTHVSLSVGRTLFIFDVVYVVICSNYFVDSSLRVNAVVVVLQ